MRISYTAEAADDLLSIVGRIAPDNPVVSGHLADRIFTIIERLAAREFDGPNERLTTGEAVQSWPVPPVRIYYRRIGDDLLVVRVYHQARRPITK